MKKKKVLVAKPSSVSSSSKKKAVAKVPSKSVKVMKNPKASQSIVPQGLIAFCEQMIRKVSARF